MSPEDDIETRSIIRNRSNFREKLVLSTVCEDLLDLCCEKTVDK